MKKYFIVLLISGIYLASCSKELMTPREAGKIAIVESYIYAGDSIIKIKVTKLLPVSDDTLNATEYISGLSIQVNGSFLTETDTGMYTLYLGGNRVKPGDSYSFRFLFNNDTISSTTTIPATPEGLGISASSLYATRVTSTNPGFGEMDNAEVTWTNDDASYYYMMIEYLESTPDYINSSMEDTDLPVSRSISPTQANTERIDMRNIYFFGSYRAVLIKVNKDFASLYSDITTNSNNIEDPVTAIKNGYGVFTGMSTDTVYFEVKESSK
jgi:hypothetical protein